MKRILTVAFTSILLSLSLFSACSAETASLDRVEPPFWWQGFKHQELQLLVHGDSIGNLTPSVEYPGVSVTRVERVKNDNYLFIYLQINAEAPSGELDIQFRGAGQALSHKYELRSRNPDPAHARGFTSADSIYLITPDRFANGDPSNDTVAGLRDPLNRDEDYGRHGGDLAGISNSLDYIGDMGFTAIWLNPVLENAMPRWSYHGYATTDYYAVDPRFGSNEVYRQLVTDAKQKGIGVIMDIIVNHIGREHWWMDDLPADDWLNFQDSPKITTHARTTNQDPYASEFDKRRHADGWFSDDMPDLNQRNPLLADYLIQNSIWWVEYLGLAGIRQDTYPYPDKHFMSEWSRRIMDEYPDFNIVGEEWSTNPNIVSYWQAGKKNHDGYQSWLPSVMDFPMQTMLKDVLNADTPQWGSAWTPLYELLATDFLYPDPNNLVIFPDNHDMSRIYSQVNEDYDLFRIAIVFNLTMRGIPQIYYGTEILMANPGTESHGVIRSDFPGGWAGDERNAFTGDGMLESEIAAQQFMRKLLNWRKQNSVIHHGELMHYAPRGEVYVYFRYDENDVVMVIMNRGEDSVELPVEQFAERLTGKSQAIDVISGNRYDVRKPLTLRPRSVLLLEIFD